MEYERILSPSEAKYKYFSLTKKVREDFPEKDVVFTGKFNGKKYDLRVNNKDCIMLTQLYYAHEFSEGDTVTFKKIKDNEFEISVE